MNAYGSMRMFLHTCGSSGWNDSPVQAGFVDEVNLDGWVTSRVVDIAGVNFGDCHDELCTGEDDLLY